MRVPAPDSTADKLFIAILVASVSLTIAATPVYALNAPTSFFGNNVTENSVTWNWNDTSSDEDGFEVQDNGDSRMADIGADNTSLVESGLEENTVYTRHVRAFTATPGTPETIEIGGGGYYGYWPIDNYLTNYSRCQSLYCRSEIDQPGTITKIKFDKYSTDSSTVNNCTIYLFETDDATLSDWVGGDNGAGTEVFSGTLNVPTSTGWYEITLDTPFYYGNAKNLLVSFRHQHGVNENDELEWVLSSKADRCVYGYDDAVNPPDVSVQSYLPDVQFVMEDEIRNYGSPSNNNSACTLIHDPGDADLSLADIGGRRAQISVTPPTNKSVGLTGVYIDRDEDGADWSNAVLVSTWSQTYIQIDTLPSNGTWYYRIRFRNQNGVETGNYSEAVDIASQPLNSPTGFYGDTVNDSSITWHWTDTNGNEEGYEVQNMNDDMVATAGADNESTVESGLNENSVYTRHCHGYYAVPNPADYIDGFETSAEMDGWVTGGEANWYVTSPGYSGSNCARSGAIGDWDATYIEKSFDMGPQGGSVKFWWNVSSESGCDFLTFNIDDTWKEEISGSTGWVSSTYPLNAGLRKLTWEYSKDGSLFDGSDCGWIDQIEIMFPGILYFGPPSNNASRCTLIHVPGDPDLALADAGNREARITVTPPLNSTLNQTGVYIDRDDNIGFSTPELVSDWSKAYTQVNPVPSNGLWYFRIKFRNQWGNETATYFESVNIVSTPIPAPTDFYGDTETNSSITWHWTDNSGSEDGFRVENDTDDEIISVGANIETTIEDGLEENTVCSRHCHAFEVLSSGTENPTIGVAEQDEKPPLDIFYNYSRCQMLYLQSEIGYQGNITKIYFDEVVSNSVTINDVSINMFETDDLALTDWVGGDNGAGIEVFSGDLTTSSSPGWYQITLDTPFYYSNTKNLLISIRHQDGAYEASYPTWHATDSPNRCLYNSSDDENPPVISSLSNISYLPDIKFEIDTVLISSSPPSNTNSACTLIHDPGDPDLGVYDLGATQTQVIVEPPFNPNVGLTGVYIDRSDNGSDWGSPFLVSDWTNTYTHIDPVPGTGTWYYRIKFRNQYGVETATYFESVEITSIPLNAPTVFYGDSATCSSITWNWNDLNGIEDGYRVENSLDDLQALAGPDETVTIESGLDENAVYTRHCHAYKDYAGPPQDVSIGVAESSYWYPINNYFKYGRCQVIYLRTEIGTPGTINSIRFNKSNDKSATVNNLTIYMFETSDTSLSGWVGGDNGAGVKVFDGTLNITSDLGWFEIVLDTPFVYSGDYNLLVSIRHQDGVDDNVDLDWKRTSAAGRCVYGEGAVTNPPDVSVENHIPDTQFQVDSVNRDLSPPSPSNSSCTIVHNPDDPDLSLSDIGDGEVQIIVAGPNNGTLGLTGVYIDRDNEGSVWDDAVEISTWSKTYIQTDPAPYNGTWYYRIKFRNQYAVETDTYYESVLVTSAPPIAPSGFYGVATSNSSISWWWNDDSFDEDGFEVQNSSDAMMAETGQDINNTIESGLEENVVYTRHCRSYSNFGEEFDNATIYDGMYFANWPIDPWLTKYSRCQMLYLQSEIGLAGTINKLWFYQYDGVTVTVNNCSIYMFETTDSALANSWYGPDSGPGVEVYNGSLSFVSDSGWYEIILDIPFIYSGEKNLLVSFRHQHGESVNTELNWTMAEIENRCVYGYDDVQNPPNAYLTDGLPDIQFEIDTRARNYSSATTDDSVATLVHEPDDPDLLLSEMAGGRVQLTITPPPNSTLSQTGVYIDRDQDGGDWGDAYMIKDWSADYSIINYVPYQGIWYYRIKFRNQDGIETGTYFESVNVTSDPPATQQPVSLQVGEEVNPPSLGKTLTFSAVHVHPGMPVPAHEAWIQVDNDSDFLSLKWDSGWFAISPVSDGNRCAQLSYTGPALTTGETYYWRIRFGNEVPQETPWSTENAWFVIADYSQVLPYRGYHLLNIPCFTGSRTLGELLDDDLSIIWIFKYDEASRAWVQVGAGNTFENNVGYFVWSKTPGEVAGLCGDPIGGSGDAAIDLSWNNTGSFGNDGWNLIRNPFSQAVSWESCSLQNCEAKHWRPWNNDGKYYEWYMDSGNKSPGGTDSIPGGASFWVHAEGENASITIPDPGPPPAPQPLPPPALQWRVLVIAGTGTYMDSGTYFSMREGALETHDSYDVLELDPFSNDYIQAYFDHPEWGYYAGRYTQDTRPFPTPDGSVEWKLTVHATDADGSANLSWTVPEELRAFWLFHLRDDAVGVTQSMLFDNEYIYSALGDDTREFTITATKLREILLGDSDMDGEVTGTDAAFCARAEHSLESLSPEQRYVSDLNSDGKVDILDALLILRRLKKYLSKNP